MAKLELDISNLPPKEENWLRCFRLALTIDKRTSCRTSIVIQTTNPKKYLFPFSQSLYWRPSADQKARGLWVRDCDIRGQEIGQYGVCFLLGKRKIKLCGNALFRNKAGVNLFFPETCIDVVRCLCCDIFLY